LGNARSNSSYEDDLMRKDWFSCDSSEIPRIYKIAGKKFFEVRIDEKELLDEINVS
jgi:hypothetical protein